MRLPTIDEKLKQRYTDTINLLTTGFQDWLAESKRKNEVEQQAFSKRLSNQPVTPEENQLAQNRFSSYLGFAGLTAPIAKVLPKTAQAIAKGAQGRLGDANTQAIKKFGVIKPNEAGNIMGYVTPKGKIFKIKDHSDIAPLIGQKQGGLKENEDIKTAFMKQTNSTRIYRNADEVGIQFQVLPTKSQLDSVKKALLPDGGDFYWDGPNGTGGQFHYDSIKQGIKELNKIIPILDLWRKRK